MEQPTNNEQTVQYASTSKRKLKDRSAHFYAVVFVLPVTIVAVIVTALVQHMMG